MSDVASKSLRNFGHFVSALALMILMVQCFSLEADGMIRIREVAGPDAQSCSLAQRRLKG